MFPASIRAYGTQQTFKNELARRIDRYSRAARTFYNLNRWVTIRMDAAGSLLAASLAAYLVYFQSNIAATTGFSLNMAGMRAVAWDLALAHLYQSDSAV